MVGHAWLVLVLKPAVQVKFQRSSVELATGLHRIDLIEMSGGSNYLGLVV